MGVDLTSRLKEVEDWLIDNRGDMDHVFHVHGVQFQLISSTRTDTAAAQTYRASIDVIKFRAGEVARIRIQQTKSGNRMFHCHILEHEDQGMMGVLEVQV